MSLCVTVQWPLNKYIVVSCALSFKARLFHHGRWKSILYRLSKKCVPMCGVFCPEIWMPLVGCGGWRRSPNRIRGLQGTCSWDCEVALMLLLSFEHGGLTRDFQNFTRVRLAAASRRGPTVFQEAEKT